MFWVLNFIFVFYLSDCILLYVFVNSLPKDYIILIFCSLIDYKQSDLKFSTLFVKIEFVIKLILNMLNKKDWYETVVFLLIFKLIIPPAHKSEMHCGAKT